MISAAIAVLIAVVALTVVAVGVMIAKLFVKVEQGKALIVSTMRSVEVTFTGRVVVPVIHKAEVMDISVKTIEIDRRGTDGLICCDNIRADIKVTFFVRVNKTQEDVIKVAQAIGCVRASDPATLEELFSAKFSEALKTVGKQLDFIDLYTKRHEFRDQIIQVIGTDLNGYVLEDCAIDYLEQTPLDKLDQNNILDAQGIRKITELTTIEHVRTNEFLNTEKKQITKQNVEAAEAILELERQKADAEAKQRREVESVRAREQAEVLKVQAEERQKAELARIRADEEIKINEENQKRQVEVAQKNRERVIAVETERVERDRLMEVISREREVELQRIAKDKDLETEKREIANVIRERIAVERTVAEQEEAIKRIRVVEEAQRLRESAVIAAEGEAQEKLVKDIKAAEAAEKAATHRAREQVMLAEAQAQEALVRDVKAAEAAEQAAAHKAREKITLAQADLEATDKEAQAKVRIAQADLEATEKRAAGQVRLAEALKAEHAAPGLASVEVKERDAGATEKLGIAEAHVLRERGTAQAAAILERLKAEAQGLTDKAKALEQFDDGGRQHEEFRLGLETRRDVDLAGIAAQREVAEEQARIIAEGLKNSKIDIVGGDTAFFERLVGAIGIGKAVDHMIGSSTALRGLLESFANGGTDPVTGLREALAKAIEHTPARNVKGESSSGDGDV